VTKKKISRSFPVKGAIVINLIKFLALLPLPVSRLISGFFAWISFQTNSKSRKVTEVNLKLCYPDMAKDDRNALTLKSIMESGYLMAETAKIWIHPPQQILPMIEQVDGELMLSELMSSADKGTLIISPHLGNWELLYSYLANHFNSAALYRPPKIAELEPIILAGRGRSGGKMIRTSQMDVRKMLKTLQQAESLFLLPDQQPQQGSGVFAPFYGQPAYTMTLLQGLAKRTGADIVMATCIRQASGFKLSFNLADLDVSLSNEDFAKQLNLLLEAEINKIPEQYEWAYKRFKACTDSDPDLYK